MQRALSVIGEGPLHVQYLTELLMKEHDVKDNLTHRIDLCSHLMSDQTCLRKDYRLLSNLFQFVQNLQPATRGPA